ncbi:multiple cyclophane-containing RiPP AmcA [Micromonospora sonchi]|uniref:multiple cyclophane-containing RiPP AmcA n=1 Tax=Micromonospora sonchi TaxID=1763543 RepID=UPI0027E44E12|nr:multiple cyclophane-containing RiPP AmcA [Micromonospora sonchi]
MYVSRNAAAGEPPRDRAADVPPVARPGRADPPLLTPVWRIVFERQARERDRR